MSLRETLFTQVAGGDVTRVEQTCREHAATIIDEFAAWQTVPEPVREDAAAMQRYANGLITVARVFAERLGDDRLLRRLTGGPENPLVRWERELQAATEEMESLDYEAATLRLEALVDETNALRGSGADQLRPITLGYLGECLFQQGRGDEALAYYELALAGVRAIGDVTGIAAYLDNLYEVNRYLARGADAATYADELARVFAAAGRERDAQRLARRAALARAGEPRNRVVATLSDGSTVELDEVTKFDGHIKFSFQRDRVGLRRATALVEEGERAGAVGDYPAALAKFREAARIDPQHPHARYQEGFTLVLLRRYEEGVAAYAATEARAPGWFHCRADHWVAQQLAAGTLDHAMFEALRELEDGAASPADKLALADAMIAKLDVTTLRAVAGFHFARGRQLALLERPEEARAALAAGLAHDPEPDLRTRLLVQLAILTPDSAERTRLFEEAVRVGGNLVAAATAQLILRNS